MSQLPFDVPVLDVYSTDFDPNPLGYASEAEAQAAYSETTLDVRRFTNMAMDMILEPAK